MNQSTKLIQKLKQKDEEKQSCYRKVGRAITKGGAIGKSPILLSLLNAKAKRKGKIIAPSRSWQAIAICVLLLFANAFKSVKERQLLLSQ